MIKQIIVVRKDLKMRRGKEIAQGAHASMMFLTSRLRVDPSNSHIRNIAITEVERRWLKESHAKICVRVDSELQLMEIHQKALGAGLVSHTVTDLGRTEFNGVPTITCCAIGPDESEKIDFITGHLELY